MKTRILLLSILTILIYSCQQSKIEIPEDRLLALFVVDEADKINRKDNEKQEILIIGKIENDTIIEIDDWDEVNHVEINERAPLLNKYSKYFTYKSGKIIEEITTKQIVKNEYYCSELTVGKTLLPKYDYQNKFTLALNYHTTFYENLALDLELPISMFQLIAAEFDQEMKSSGSNKKIISTKIENIISANLDDDKMTEIIVVGNSTVEDGSRNSTIIIYNIVDGFPEPKFAKSVQLREGSWGSGYELLDITDLNNNGQGELFFKVSGWEAVGFEIYELTSSGFKKIFDTVTYGC